MENIGEILKKLVIRFPKLEIYITNILSAEIRENRVFILFPEIEEIKKGLQKFFNGKKNIFDSYFFDISFVKDYRKPFLPFTVLNSKYKNYIFYLKVDGGRFYSFIIQKNKLFAGKIKKEYIENFFGNYDCNGPGIEKIIKTSLQLMYSRLKDSWTYLHPVIFYNDESINLRLDSIFNEVVEDLQMKFNDIRRFVGQPFFSFYDLESYIDKNMEIEDES